MTLYFPLLGPYSPAPTIFEVDYTYSWDKRVTHEWLYDCSVGSFVPHPHTGNFDFDKYHIPCFYDSLDDAIQPLIDKIRHKGYSDKTPHFTAFHLHWPELFI